MTVKIMLVDDDHISRVIIEQLLVKHGYEVVACSSGTQAVITYMKSPCPIILMDCGMPNMDGFVTTESIRMVEREQALHPALIIALTGKTHIEYRNQCIECGMNDFLPKPIKEDELLALVQTSLIKLN